MAPPALPRINEEPYDPSVEAIGVTNASLETIRDTINKTSGRIHFRLGKVMNLLADMRDAQKVEATGDTRDSNALFGVNVKLASIAMILSSFFDEQRDRWTRESLTNNNNSQSRPPPRPSQNDDQNRWRLNMRDIDAPGFAEKVLTAIGIAFLGAKLNLGQAIEESGILAYMAKAVSKAFVLGSGIAELASKMTSIPAIASITKGVGAFLHGINSLAHTFVPFYSLGAKMLKFTGKILPMVAFVTTILDFMRGFQSAEGMFDGIKEGIAEVAAGWVGWPLEILKDIVSWAAGKLGFENFAEYLDSIDLVEPVKGAVRSMFETVKSIFDFSNVDWSEWRSSLPKVTDILFTAANVGINVIRDMFSIGDPEKPFRMSEFLTGVINSATEIVQRMFNDITSYDFSELFTMVKDKFVSDMTKLFDDIGGIFGDAFAYITSMIPSVEDIVSKFKSYLPDWMTKESDFGFADRLKQIDDLIAEQTDLVKRSKGGENVFIGPEDWGRNTALAKIDEANKIREQLMAEKEKRLNQKGQAPVYNFVRGGDSTTNASSVNMNNYSGSPSNTRPD